MGRILLVLAAMAAAPLSAHPPAARPAGEARLAPAARGAAASVDAFHAALRRGDTKSAAARLADDAVIFESGGVERSKAEYAAHHLIEDAEFSKAVPSVVTRRTGSADGTTAWIASEGRMTGTYSGKALDRVTTETMILRRVGRDWKIVHIHWSSAPAP